MIFGIPAEHIRLALILPAWVITWYSIFLGAVAVPIGMMVGIWIERYRFNRLAKYYPERAKARRRTAEPRDLRLADLRRGSAIAALLTTAFMLLAVSIAQFYWIWVIHALSAILCLFWWGRLRRDGVRHAEVWVAIVWLTPRLVWAVYALGYGLVEGVAYYPFLGDEDTTAESGFGRFFGGIAVFGSVLVLTVLVLAGIVNQSLRRSVRFKSGFLGLLLIPCVVYFAYSEPLGHAHIVFVLMAVGYAISKEMRRLDLREFVPLKDVRWRRRVLWGLTATVFAVGAASLIVNVTFAVNVLREMVDEQQQLVILLIVPAICVGTCGMVAALWSYAAGTAHKYGAVAFGVGSMLLLALTFKLTSDPEGNAIWSLPAYAGTTAVVMGALLTMWYVFGPGATAHERTSAVDATSATEHAPTEGAPPRF